MSRKGIIFKHYDRKSAANNLKHGLDFEQAKSLWGDERITEVAVTLKDELRTLLTGMCNDRLWTVVVTQRGNRIRIISVRRARRNEIEKYYSERV
jgi:uncharacterized DUF497 family protein